MDVSIVILNYKSKGLVGQCIKTVLLYPHRQSYEIIVVDNNSADGIEEFLKQKYPQVKFIASPNNIGYAAGNNLGIKQAVGRYVLIMNPDITIRPGSIDALVDYMDANPDVGIVGPKLLLPNGTVDKSCYRFPTPLIPIYRRTPLGKTSFGQQALANYLRDDFDYNQTIETDWLLGAVHMVRREAIEKVGLLDENYFLYFEDTDWCLRFWQAGYKVVYYVDAVMIHYHARLSAKLPWFFGLFSYSTRTHIRSCVIYFKKWGSNQISYQDIYKSR